MRVLSSALVGRAPRVYRLGGAVTPSAVAVIVVDVGSMRVLVLQRAGRVRMAVGLRAFHTIVSVLVVGVVDVQMAVGARRVPMPVRVALADQEPRRRGHERRRGDEAGRRRLAE